MLSRKITALLVVWCSLMLSLPGVKEPLVGSRHGKTPVLEPRNHRTSKISDLDDLHPLRSAFQKDRGKVRLMTLLSPT